MKRRGVQIIEEALLIIVALMAIAITLGALNQIHLKLEELLKKVWDGLEWFFKTVFYFLPQGD